MTNASNPSSFGRWIKQLRSQHDLTQEALAELAFCSVQTIRFFETGKRRPALKTAERLANVLQVPVAERPEFLRQARATLGSDPTLISPTVVAPPAATESTTASTALPWTQPLPVAATSLRNTD